MPTFGELLASVAGALGQGANNQYQTAHRGGDWQIKDRAANNADLDAAIKRALAEVQMKRDQAGINAEAEVGASAMPDLAGRSPDEISAMYTARMKNKKENLDLSYRESQAREQGALADKNAAWQQNEQADREAALARAKLIAEGAGERNDKTVQGRKDVAAIQAGKPKAKRILKINDPDVPGQMVSAEYDPADGSLHIINGSGAMNATSANRAYGAGVSIAQGNDILAQLKNPDTQAVLGPAMGRYKGFMAGVGAGDPVFTKLAAEIVGFASLQPGLHGMRNIKMVDDLTGGLLSRAQTPEALAAAVDGLLEVSRHMSGQGVGTAKAAPASGGLDALLAKYGVNP